MGHWMQRSSCADRTLSYAGVVEAKTDADLIQIVDAALADATARSGRHLVCRPGCSQCCVGAFAINALDAERLLQGALELARTDRGRFLRMVERVKQSVARTAEDFPGDRVSGLLDGSPEGEARFDDFANDEVCPVLDPATGTCDLYAYRPMTCRVFGPPVRTVTVELDPLKDHPGTSFGMCELCFIEATPGEIVASELVADPENLETALLEEFVRAGGGTGSTTVAYALSTRMAASRIRK